MHNEHEVHKNDPSTSAAPPTKLTWKLFIHVPTHDKFPPHPFKYAHDVVDGDEYGSPSKLPFWSRGSSPDASENVTGLLNP
jgi:hypothetical protein